ncbi:hypothetical protein ACIPYS_31895 [Kitasatospora sp. NPDC089913]|uniref:hypothetical protein n=1 Tax=Kitasatospora sp. NPDC089913 TaxID=3364080 RepID=UPI003826C376
MLEVDSDLLASDKGFASKAFERELAQLGVELLQPSPSARGSATASRYSRRSAGCSGRSTAPSKGSWTWNSTAGGPSWASRSGSPGASWRWPPGIWHDNAAGAPVTRSPIAYDH